MNCFLAIYFSFWSNSAMEVIMSEECCAPGADVMILPCSGESNVGQLSNQAAVELTQEGFGKMFCLAGIGGHLSGLCSRPKTFPTWSL